MPTIASRPFSAGHTGKTVLNRSVVLERFLAGVERRAYRIACIAVRDRDDALDIVQDAMMGLVRSYADRPSEEWPPLFYRILQNQIRDRRRRRKVRDAVFGWLPGRAADDAAASDPLESAADTGPSVIDALMTNEAMKTLEDALRALPDRQREAFMMRNFEGLDVADTAGAMGCSQGSVKTHYSRAVHALRARLGDTW